MITINSVSSLTPLSGEWGVGEDENGKLLILALFFWWPAPIEEPSRSPPRVISLDQKMPLVLLCAHRNLQGFLEIYTRNRDEDQIYVFFIIIIINHYISGAPQNFWQSWGDQEKLSMIPGSLTVAGITRNCHPNRGFMEKCLESIIKRHTAFCWNPCTYPPMSKDYNCFCFSPFTSDESSCHWRNLNKSPSRRGPAKCSFQTPRSVRA